MLQCFQLLVIVVWVGTIMHALLTCYYAWNLNSNQPLNPVIQVCSCSK